MTDIDERTPVTKMLMHPCQAGKGAKNTHLEVVATYQMMGDMPGPEWAQAQFEWAKGEGLIDDYTVIGVWHAVFGIEEILFSVAIPFGAGETEIPRTADGSQAREIAEGLLNGAIIQDSDVQVVLVAGVVL